MKIKIINSNIVSAFDEYTIGAKIVHVQKFMRLLNRSIENHDCSLDKTLGQGIYDLLDPVHPELLKDAKMSVLLGYDLRTNDPWDYCCRCYRGRVQMYLKRKTNNIRTDEYGNYYVTGDNPVGGLRCVVYTKESYLQDPDVINDQEETKRISADKEATHVLVAVLAERAGEQSQVSPYRFIANLAGGNRDYNEGIMKYGDLVALAKRVKEFDDKFAIVADC